MQKIEINLVCVYVYVCLIADRNDLELWWMTAFGTVVFVRIVTNRKRSNARCAAFEKELQLGKSSILFIYLRN